MPLSNEQLLEAFERLTGSWVEATKAHTEQLTKVFGEMEGVHKDTSEIKKYFTNGFKADIIASMQEQYERTNARLNQILVATCGVVVILVGVLGKIFGVL